MVWDDAQVVAYRRRARLVLVFFLIIGGLFLAVEHRVHLYGFWPFLLLIPCLVMHRFMHGGHGHGGAGVGHSDHRLPPMRGGEAS